MGAPPKTAAGKFSFTYKIDGTNLAGTLTYPTIGWVAVGFNPTRVMNNATIIIGAEVDGKASVGMSSVPGCFPINPSPSSARFATKGSSSSATESSCITSA